ncbi:hypothetical protein T492DRAFT_843238 [Pavlovales sp. CCMP2436]|nr:hypothetical protein T492DRAFT_843238 [Pavlovales sp. CCMP2436]
MTLARTRQVIPARTPIGRRARRVGNYRSPHGGQLRLVPPRRVPFLWFRQLITASNTTDEVDQPLAGPNQLCPLISRVIRHALRRAPRRTSQSRKNSLPAAISAKFSVALRRASPLRKNSSLFITYHHRHRRLNVDLLYDAASTRAGCSGPRRAAARAGLLSTAST